VKAFILCINKALSLAAVLAFPALVNASLALASVFALTFATSSSYFAPS
jgi:hypothetical protein